MIGGLALPARQARLGPFAWLLVALCLAVGVWAGASLLPDPLRPLPAERLAPPSLAAPLGRDHLGRDVLSRLVHGGVSTLVLAGAGLGLTALLGTLAALVGGYYAEAAPGHLLGLAGQALLAFPALWLPLVVVGLLGNSGPSLVLAIVFAALPDVYWVLHREVRALRAQPFVEAARALGYGAPRILSIEILPHLVPSGLVLALLHVRQAVLVVSTLAFLGLGPPPPEPTWGLMIAEGRTYFPAAWWPVAFPSLALAGCIVAAGVLARRAGQPPTRAFVPPPRGG